MKEEDMGKNLFIAEKPSVAQEFARALKLNARKQDGYMESEDVIVTWCVGHLVTMSYPEAYDEKYRRWSLATLPFLPKEWKYEVIDGVKKTVYDGQRTSEPEGCGLYLRVHGLRPRRRVHLPAGGTDGRRKGKAEEKSLD